MSTGLRWFKFAISKVSDFRGRAGRQEFNWYFFFLTLFAGLCWAIDMIISDYPIVTSVYLVLALIPTILLIIRRLHDIGHPGYWTVVFILFPPLLFYLMLCPSDKHEPNQYGYTERLTDDEPRPFKPIYRGNGYEELTDTGLKRKDDENTNLHAEKKDF